MAKKISKVSATIAFIAISVIITLIVTHEEIENSKIKQRKKAEYVYHRTKVKRMLKKNSSKYSEDVQKATRSLKDKIRAIRKGKDYRLTISRALLLAKGRDMLKEQNRSVNIEEQYERKEEEWEEDIFEQSEVSGVGPNSMGGRLREISCGDQKCTSTFVFDTENAMERFVNEVIPNWKWRIDDLSIPPIYKVEEYAMEITSQRRFSY